MKDFVFIIPLTPKRLLNPVRQTLFDMMVYALKKQTSDNWIALLLGEEENEDGNLIYLNSEKSFNPEYVKEFRGDPGHTDKHHKIEIALQYIARSEKKPKYLIRLDDDDLISPVVIANIEKSGMTYDCYADKFQALYNIMDGKIALPHLPWMANSVFHKYEHAITVVKEFNRKLINCSHSDAFHLYYADKKVFYSQQYAPIYLRIFSETSLHINTAAKASFKSHASKYGFWHYYVLPDYEGYIAILIDKFQLLFNIQINRNTNLFLLQIAALNYRLEKLMDKIVRRAKLVFNNPKSSNP